MEDAEYRYARTLGRLKAIGHGKFRFSGRLRAGSLGEG
jgi:hypothetical protein